MRGGGGASGDWIETRGGTWKQQTRQVLYNYVKIFA